MPDTILSAEDLALQELVQVVKKQKLKRSSDI